MGPGSPTGLSRRLFPDGTAPDARFTLANERTFLAWIRTALGMVGAGVALEAFAGEVFPAALRTVLALALVLTGLVLSVSALTHWVRVERALRHDRPLPAP